jgi:hypothetical protein
MIVMKVMTLMIMTNMDIVVMAIPFNYGHVTNIPTFYH